LDLPLWWLYLGPTNSKGKEISLPRIRLYTIRDVYKHTHTHKIKFFSNFNNQFLSISQEVITNRETTSSVLNSFPYDTCKSVHVQLLLILSVFDFSGLNLCRYFVSRHCALRWIRQRFIMLTEVQE
jgi:hypothetical protein